METFRKFEITLISAKNLPNVRRVFDMKVYAKVSIGGVAETELTASVDMQGKTNPSWNYKIAYTLNEATIQNKDIIVSIKLYCQRTFKPNKYVGEVNLRLKELFDYRHAKSTQKVLTYKVCRRDSSEGEFGTLDLSYTFGEALLVEEKEVSNGKVALKIAGEVVLFGAQVVLQVAAQTIIVLLTS